MKKILNSISGYYKYVYQQMGKLGFFGLISVVALFLFGGIKGIVQTGDPVTLFVILGILFVYHIIFFFDKIKKDKKEKK